MLHRLYFLARTDAISDFLEQGGARISTRAGFLAAEVLFLNLIIRYVIKYLHQSLQ
jgi:hypothetical protein